MANPQSKPGISGYDSLDWQRRLCFLEEAFYAGKVAAHANTHEIGGGDELIVEYLSTLETNTTLVLSPDGLGGLQFQALAGTSSSSCMIFGNSQVGSTTTPRYLAAGNDEGSPAGTTAVQFAISRAGTFRNLRVRHTSGGGNGNNITYTLRVNGVPSALTTTLASTATSGSDLVHSVAVAAGDLIDIAVTRAANTAGSPTGVIASVEFV